MERGVVVLAANGQCYKSEAIEETEPCSHSVQHDKTPLNGRVGGLFETKHASCQVSLIARQGTVAHISWSEPARMFVKCNN